MYETKNTISFFGHRDQTMPTTAEDIAKIKDNLTLEIKKAINEGFDMFVTMSCHGFDLMAADLILSLKAENHPEIRLISIVPHEDMADKWDKQNHDIFFEVLAASNNVFTISAQFNYTCYREAVEALVNNSSRFICYYNGSDSNTKLILEYVKDSGKPFTNIFDYE